MRLPASPKLLALPLCAAALAAAGCGPNQNSVAQNDPTREGSQLFEAHCSGCHTLSVAGTEGSSSKVATREYKDGPNFDQRAESAEDVLYAIQNGGFSSGPMPQQILTGEDAQKVADFVAKYSGREAARPPDPQGGNPPTTPGGAEQPSDTQ
jgi:mono/diheme cytochrome c family protein